MACKNVQGLTGFCRDAEHVCCQDSLARPEGAVSVEVRNEILSEIFSTEALDFQPREGGRLQAVRSLCRVLAHHHELFTLDFVPVVSSMRHKSEESLITATTAGQKHVMRAQGGCKSVTS